MRELIILVADKDQKALLTGLIEQASRKEGWGWAIPADDIISHVNHDNGVRLEAAEFLREYQRTHRRALVLFDSEGCGAEDKTSDQLAAGVQRQLMVSGWPEDQCAVVVISPEVESWLWVGETHIQEVIGWRGPHSVYEWLRLQTPFLPDSTSNKPARPKEAFHAALRHVRLPPSSSLFQKIAARASYKRCHDPAFIKLLAHLRQWFGPPQ